MRILITGGKGYIARNLARLFNKHGGFDVFSPSKDQLNLLYPHEITKIMEEINPNIIIHAAIKGGTVVDNDTLQDIIDNVAMYENLMTLVPEKSTVFILGSGAEFNRNDDIDCAEEEDVERSFPTDPYGIAKNIIVRRSLSEHQNTYVVRLFGCFNYDEESFRFIKRCILNIKNKIPIEIPQNKLMDFFYMDDVFTVINSLITSNSYRHINLVYQDKYSLLDISSMIFRAVECKNYPIHLGAPTMGPSYTGNGEKLASMNIKLIGLEEGIVRTCRKLL